MKKEKMIELSISDVWEIVNKPRRLLDDIRKQVEELPLGDYEYLNFDQETKDEMLDRFDEIRKTGRWSSPL